jgi:hypothetical protein
MATAVVIYGVPPFLLLRTPLHCRCYRLGSPLFLYAITFFILVALCFRPSTPSFDSNFPAVYHARLLTLPLGRHSQC